MEKSNLKILTWNIDRNESDIEIRFPNLLKEIEELTPDIVCLQENIKNEKYNIANHLVSRYGYSLVSYNENDSYVLVKDAKSHSSIFDLATDKFLACGKIQIKDREFMIGSAHLSWGTGKESVRLNESLLIENLFAKHTELDPFRSKNDVIGILCGDLNTEPQSATLRYLTGLGVENGSSTMWTDSWIKGNDAGITSSATNILAGRTAKSVGLKGLNLPERRIDYILVRGFAYSRPGEFIATKLVGNYNSEDKICSDHYWILTTLSV